MHASSTQGVKWQPLAGLAAARLLAAAAAAVVAAAAAARLPEARHPRTFNSLFV
jgi:hypothetical protein